MALHLNDRRSFLRHAGGGAMLLGGSLAKLGRADESRRKLRVGQLGTKHGHAAGKLQTVLKYPEHFDFVGVAENDDTQWARVQESKPYKDVARMSEAALLAAGLDLVLVEGDIEELLPAALRSLRAGCHVHLDKPAGTNLQTFESLLELAIDKQLLVQMGYMYRSNPAFQFMFNAVQQGWLGDIFEVHAVMSKKIGPAARKPLARFSGGSMFELGCHLIDAVVYLLGRPQEILTFNQELGNDGLRDNCLAVFDYPNATATIRSSLVEVDGFRRRQFVVCGTAGTIEIVPLDRPKLTLTLEQSQEVGASPFIRGNTSLKKGTHEVSLPDSPGRYDGDLLALAAAILGQTEYPYSYKHDFLVQRCILEASGMLA